MKNLPKAITFLQFRSIAAYDDDGGEEVNVFIGDIAEHTCESLLPYLALIIHLDCGIRMVIFTLETRTKIKENNTIVSDREYVGTPGLQDLIVATTPDDKIFINGDYDNYAEIMHSKNALRRNNDESETKPKANKSWKWKHVLKPIWGEQDICTGNGTNLG